jgi:uncharacterized membrane protein YuzA (DUF378 family)
MDMNKQLDVVALLLVIVGALNWGLVGLFKFDLVAEVVGEKFGAVNAISRVVYILVAASGLYLVSLVTRVGRSTDQLTTSYR